MKYLKSFNESFLNDVFKTVGDCEEFIEELKSKNEIILEVDDVMNNLYDLIGHDTIVPLYELHFKFKGGWKLYTLLTKSAIEYNNYEDDYVVGEMNKIDFNLIKSGTDFNLRVTYLITFDDWVEFDDKMISVVRSIGKHLTNIGCELEVLFIDYEFTYDQFSSFGDKRIKSLEDFRGFFVKIPIKL